jgi:hypothetical protein
MMMGYPNTAEALKLKHQISDISRVQNGSAFGELSRVDTRRFRDASRLGDSDRANPLDMTEQII